jgi:hypothetical protein
MGNKALKIPAATVAIGRLTERDDARFARAQMLHDAFDGPVLAGCVTPLQEHENLEVPPDQVALQLDELYLQRPEFPPVSAFRGLFSRMAHAPSQ